MEWIFLYYLAGVLGILIIFRIVYRRIALRFTVEKKLNKWGSCEWCGSDMGQPMWFDNGKSVYYKYLCGTCVNKMLNDMQDLKKTIEKRLDG